LESAVKEIFMAAKTTSLGDLISIGPAMLRDFELLGIRSVEQLAKADPEKMYQRLGRLARQHQDICVLDVFRAAVAQARDPRLPAEQCQWWYWSKKRKDNAETPFDTQGKQSTRRKRGAER
jgi:nucleotidyltransferase/DNA polymerase involved in DNA repair